MYKAPLFSHSLSTEEVNSHYVNTQGPVFWQALLSFICAANTFRVVSRVSEHNRKQPPTVFSQEMVGKCIWPLYSLQSCASKPALLSHCSIYIGRGCVSCWLFTLPGGTARSSFGPAILCWKSCVAKPKSYKCVCKTLSYGQCFSNTQVSSKSRIFFPLRAYKPEHWLIKREWNEDAGKVVS